MDARLFPSPFVRRAQRADNDLVDLRRFRLRAGGMVAAAPIVNDAWQAGDCRGDVR
ncbi:MAG: hypothetical protein QOJ59_2888 [Thermomicrobiales bacterium]|jgi:hypothetical protein|nr:hypothetical protein [Thermomicrobiales bacterium]